MNTGFNLSPHFSPSCTIFLFPPQLCCFLSSKCAHFHRIEEPDSNGEEQDDLLFSRVAMVKRISCGDDGFIVDVFIVWPRGETRRTGSGHSACCNSRPASNVSAPSSKRREADVTVKGEKKVLH